MKGQIEMMPHEVAQYGGDTPVTYSTEEILAQRKRTHGDFTDHARITQAIKAVMRATDNWPRLSDVQREALEMNAHKVGRILAGNPNVADHWDDIAGYAKLVPPRFDSAA